MAVGEAIDIMTSQSGIYAPATSSRCIPAGSVGVGGAGLRLLAGLATGGPPGSAMPPLGLGRPGEGGGAGVGEVARPAEGTDGAAGFVAATALDLRGVGESERCAADASVAGEGVGDFDRAVFAVAEALGATARTRKGTTGGAATASCGAESDGRGGAGRCGGVVPVTVPRGADRVAGAMLWVWSCGNGGAGRCGAPDDGGETCTGRAGAS